MTTTDRIQKELKRWFNSFRDCDIHHKINNRGIMQTNHILSLDIHSDWGKVRSKNEIGTVRHLTRYL